MDKLSVVKVENSDCVPLHRSLHRRSVLAIFAATEEYWVTGDGHPSGTLISRFDKQIVLVRGYHAARLRSIAILNSPGLQS